MNLQQLKIICQDEKIPILRDKSLSYILSLIASKKYNSILEVGTAYGYSAFALSEEPNIKTITTLEINKENHLKAKSFLKDIKKIETVNIDANLFISNIKFDLIFIDGAKSNQESLFAKLSNNLKENGTIIIDNIYLKKVTSIENPNKNHLKLIEKVARFKTWLLNLIGWDVKIIDIDDGIAICQKNK